MPFPNPPTKIVPFESGPVAAHDIGRQFDEHAKSVSNVIDFLRTVVRDDGVVKNHTIGPEQLREGLSDALAKAAVCEVEDLLRDVRLTTAAASETLAEARRVLDNIQQYQRNIAGYADDIRVMAEGVRTRLGEIEALALAPAPVSAPITNPVGALGPNTGNPMAMYSADDLGATAIASDYAQVSIEWAEHMPDTIPPNVLAINAITGDHWSSRWWANRAAQIVAALPVGGSIPAGQGVYCETLTVTAPNTFAPLTYIPAGPVTLYYNGLALPPTGANPAFVVNAPAKQVVWTSDIYDIPVGADVQAIYPYTNTVTPVAPSTTTSISLYYVATAGQTVFSVTTPDYYGNKFTSGVTGLRVNRNGARLMPDYGSGVGGYTINGGTITLLYPAGAGEIVGIDVWSS